MTLIMLQRMLINLFSLKILITCLMFVIQLFNFGILLKEWNMIELNFRSFILSIYFSLSMVLIMLELLLLLIFVYQYDCYYLILEHYITLVS